jgi:hypothetical protein
MTHRRWMVRFAAVPAAYLMSTYGTWLAHYLISGAPPRGAVFAALYTWVFAVIYFGTVSVVAAVLWLYVFMVLWPSTPAGIKVVSLLVLAALPLLIRVGLALTDELAVQAIAQFLFFLVTLVIAGRATARAAR